MKVRTIPPTPGAKGWTRDSLLHPLPAGLPDRAPITAAALDMPHIVVRDGNGQEWKLLHWQVDFGAWYAPDAENWLHESQPRVLDALQGSLARHEARPRPGGLTGAAYDAYAKSLRWILERNGWKP